MHHRLQATPWPTCPRARTLLGPMRAAHRQPRPHTSGSAHHNSPESGMPVHPIHVPFSGGPLPPAGRAQLCRASPRPGSPTHPVILRAFPPSKCPSFTCRLSHPPHPLQTGLIHFLQGPPTFCKPLDCSPHLPAAEGAGPRAPGFHRRGPIRALRVRVEAPLDADGALWLPPQVLRGSGDPCAADKLSLHELPPTTRKRKDRQWVAPGAPVHRAGWGKGSPPH